MTARLTAEALGSGFLVMAVLGSGIAASELSPDDVGLQLFQNAAATAGALIALIATFALVSGAHFNPAVTLVERFLGKMTTREAAAYVTAQVVGGCVGAMVTNVMFLDLDQVEAAVFVSGRDRATGSTVLAEVVATLGLLLVIHGTSRLGRPSMVAVSVGVWIGGAYYFTSSTSFANPMVTIARTLSDTFAGIAPASVPAFVAAQLVGAVLVVPLVALLFTETARHPVDQPR